MYIIKYTSINNDYKGNVSAGQFDQNFISSFVFFFFKIKPVFQFMTFFHE